MPLRLLRPVILSAAKDLFSSLPLPHCRPLPSTPPPAEQILRRFAPQDDRTHPVILSAAKDLRQDGGNARGKVTAKLVPRPGSLSTLIEPPWACASWRAIASRAPEPPVSRARDGSAR